MDANLLMAITGLGLAGGVGAIVFVKWRGNGHHNGTPPPEVPLAPSPTAELERITGRLDRILERQAPSIHPYTPWDPLGPAGPGGVGGRPTALLPPSGPAPHSTDITLTMFNTYFLVAGEVYVLIPPESGSHNINVANLGPGNMFLRADADPAPGDPQSEILPAGAVDNLIHIPQSLRVIVDVDSFLSARLSYQ